MYWSVNIAFYFICLKASLNEFHMWLSPVLLLPSQLAVIVLFAALYTS